MSDLPKIFDLVEAFLDGHVSQSELKDWLAARLGWIVDEAETPQGKLAARAQHLCFLLHGGAIDESEARREFEAGLLRWAPVVKVRWHLEPARVRITAGGGGQTEAVVIPELVTGSPVGLHAHG